MTHVGSYAAAFLLCLLFTGSVGGEALVSAGTLSAVAVGAAELIRRVAARPIAFSPADAAACFRAIGKLPGDTVRIGVALLWIALAGDSLGRGIVRPFRFGEIDAPHQRGRRATAVVAGSLTPDTIVVHVAPGRDAICHRLLDSALLDRPERLA